jgi:hypothetical protein
VKIEIDGSGARSAARTTVDYLVALLAWLSRRVRALGSTAAVVGRALGTTAAARLATAWRRTSAGTRTALGQLRSVLVGDTSRRTVAALRRGLFGRRIDASIAALLLAPILALVAEWWVVRTVGYRTVEGWVRGTWTGTDPQLLVFLAAGALVTLAAASAAVNSGLLPTTALVTGPLFGVAFTRYGLVLEPYGTVGLAEATGTGLLLAAAFGVPVAVVGFLLGTACRRVATTLRGGAGGGQTVEGV